MIDGLSRRSPTASSGAAQVGNFSEQVWGSHTSVNTATDCATETLRTTPAANEQD